VHRRSITFATGLCNTKTRVVWVQAHAMTADIRIHSARPPLVAGTALETLDRNTLSALASVEGGVARTSWADGIMSWSDWIGFQPYEKYPEAGQLRRVGGCMIEFAPSGIYVEDWRCQPSEPGLLAGLWLVAEVESGGKETARSGGLVIAGDHAILTLARPSEFPTGTRAQDAVRRSSDPAAAIERVYGCSVDYAVRGDGSYRVELSTDPRREGMALNLTDRFATTQFTGILRQDVTDTPGITARLWRIDSLEAGVTFRQNTSAPADRLAWLQAEADTLVDPIGKTT
jgi:hypothetical protein